MFCGLLTQNGNLLKKRQLFSIKEHFEWKKLSFCEFAQFCQKVKQELFLSQPDSVRQFYRKIGPGLVAMFKFAMASPTNFSPAAVSSLNFFLATRLMLSLIRA